MTPSNVIGDVTWHHVSQITRGLTMVHFRGCTAWSKNGILQVE